MRKRILWFWKYYKRFPAVLAILLGLTPVVAAVSALMPRLIEYSIDYVRTGQVPDKAGAQWVVQIGSQIGLSPAAALPAMFFVLGLIVFVLYTTVMGSRARMNRRFEWEFRQVAFENLTDKGPDFATKFRTGDIVTRLTDDVENKLSWFACSGIFRMYEAVMTVLFIIIMMIGIDPWLTLWVAGPLPLVILIFFRSATLLDKRFDHLQGTISTMNAVMEACFSGIRVVKAYIQEKAQIGRFRDSLSNRRQAELAAIRSQAIVESLYGSVWQFGIIIVLLFGGWLVVGDRLTTGELFSFVYYGTSLFFPMYDIGQFFTKSLQSAVSIDRLVEMEKVSPMVVDTGTVGLNGGPTGHLRFVDVSFTMPGATRPILDRVSMEVKPRQTIALVGRVGAGKTWLLQMVPRLVDPTQGYIELDGRDMREYRLEDLRNAIGYVPQEPVLFSDTVRANLMLGRDGISDTLLEWAIEVSQMREEIAGFPKGMDTAIGTRGMSISGGQKQRLSLARALVTKPRLLILDDCTSALDARTEAALWDRLHQVLPEMTTILVTHRPDTLERVDLIYVMDSGRIVEQGCHHDLIAANGEYARIYRRLQLEKEVG